MQQGYLPHHRRIPMIRRPFRPVGGWSKWLERGLDRIILFKILSPFWSEAELEYEPRWIIWGAGFLLITLGFVIAFGIHRVYLIWGIPAALGVALLFFILFIASRRKKPDDEKAAP